MNSRLALAGGGSIAADSDTTPYLERLREVFGKIVSWVFGVATVVTYIGKASMAERTIVETPATYKKAPLYLAMGVGAEEAGGRTAEAANTKLTKEKMSRSLGTSAVETVTHTGDTMKVEGSITATEELKVNEAGLFEGSSGEIMATSATFNIDTLANGDSITFKWKVTFS